MEKVLSVIVPSYNMEKYLPKCLGSFNSSLARRMKASRPYVTKVLNGDVNITLGTASRFAKALGMDFFCGLREPGSKESGGLDDEAAI